LHGQLAPNISVQNKYEAKLAIQGILKQRASVTEKEYTVGLHNPNEIILTVPEDPVAMLGKGPVSLGRGGERGGGYTYGCQKTGPTPPPAKAAGEENKNT
jgi:hypothetical protein